MSVPSAAFDFDDFSRRLAPYALRLLTREPWRAAAFTVVSFVLGIAWFVALVVLIVVGIGFGVTIVGLPILVMVIHLWVRGAKRERRRIAAFSGEQIPSPYRPAPPGRWWARTNAFLHDPAIWRDLAYLLLLLPVGIAKFVVAAAAVGLTGAFITLPLYFWAGTGPDFFGGWRVDSMPEAIAGTLLGLLMTPFTLMLLIALGRAHVEFAKSFLGPSSEQLEERVDILTRSRSGVMEAMLLERRRIERDLHDGAQQRLVALAMDLGMAKEKMATDPEAARQLVEASHDEAKRVLVDLRDLVRGIHPAVLTDRGLDAAISAVAGRSSVPVTVDVHLKGRLPEAVESTAYFVVVEALTNVAKHTTATEAIVRVRREQDWLVVEVMDNGNGGASTAEGSGLAGLAERLAALDGRMLVESPAGGPTRVRAEIPCGS